MQNSHKQSVYGEIPFDWRVDSLKNVCAKKDGILTGPFGSQLHQRDYQSQGTPIITVEHLGENYLLHSDLPRVSDSDCERLSRYSLQNGDIVFSRVGSVDRRALVRKDETGWLFSGRCLRVRPNRNVVNPEFLSWFFGLPVFKDYICRIAVGATMPSLNTEILSNVEIIMPPLHEQTAIGEFLSALANKILLNNKMNETLEAIGQTIFRRWFVDFEFPNEEGKPYRSSGGEMVYDKESKREIPDGWKTVALGEVAEFVRGFSYRGVEKSKSAGELAFTTLNSIYEGGGFKREFSYLTSDRLKERHFVKEGDIVIANTEQTKTGTLLGFPALVEFPNDYVKDIGCFSHHITKVNPLVAEMRYYLYYFLHFSQSNAIKYHTGSVIWALDVKGFTENEKIAVPNRKVLAAFSEIMSAIFRRRLLNNKQSTSITVIRDMLLPRLMSGKIRVPVPKDNVEPD